MIIRNNFNKKDLYCDDTGLYNGELGFKGIVEWFRAYSCKF